MRAVDVVTEVCLASAEEAMRFSHFVQAFLSRNGFPFIMIHNAPDLTGERRRVEFEDPSISRRFAQEWRSARPMA
jgi:hypothetical protein